MSTLKEQIDEQFVKAIRKTFKPCPLIGPRWLQEFPRGKPADFRYFGVRKLAKATGRPVKGIAKILLGSISLKELGLEMNVLDSGLIDINRVVEAEDDENCRSSDHALSAKKRGRPPRISRQGQG
jgi:hypothetical protein